MPYRSIDDPVKLRRVLEAVLLLESDLELPVLLRHVIEEARSMTNARYGALGVLNANGTALAEFLTSGLGPEVEEQIGNRPTGKGVLGLLISDPRPLRLANLGAHPESYGFPHGHPRMDSFLGVSIHVRDEVYGNLYLTDKLGWSEFTQDDEALVSALAAAAGIAIENARLHERVQQVAIYEERDRLARDLHDNVIQRLFAVGLSLQSLAGLPTLTPVADRVQATVADIDDTIRQIRASIFELTSSDGDRGVRSAVLALVQELGPMLGFDPKVVFDGPVDTAIAATVAEHLLAATREAVTNVAKHAEATVATVTVVVAEGTCRLEVGDNGRGLGGPSNGEGGLGLVNLRRRAEKLHGSFDARNRPSGGTVLTWQVPIGS
ncbi:MAG: GAF domain-containing sensor histidine kinase [Acidimicrobiales bacterium]